MLRGKPISRTVWPDVYKRQPQNRVDHHIQSLRAQSVDSLIEAGEGISSAYQSSGLFVDRLQAQFHTHRFKTVQFKKQLQNLPGKAVRPGSHREAHHIRMRQGFCEKNAQVLRWSIGVRISLKIRNKTAGWELFLYPGLLRFNLVRDGE